MPCKKNYKGKRSAPKKGRTRDMCKKNKGFTAVNKQIVRRGSDIPAGYLFSNLDLRRLIIPLIIEQILAVTVGMADTMMVSSAGEAATSGVSLVDMINTLLINLFAALATGGAVVASQYLGQKRADRASAASNQLLLVTGLISLVIMALALAFRENLLRLLYGDIEADVLANAMLYLMISAFSYPFLAIYNSCAALFRAMGNSKISMQAALGMNVINVFGDALLIFGFHMGVAGAAIASLAGRMAACLILFYRLQNPKLSIHIDFKREHWKWNPLMVRNILHIGIPGGVENSIFQLGRVLVVSIITSFGTMQIAANAVANNLDNLGILPGQAMGLAMITVIGRCVGAMDFKQADYYAKKLLRLTYLTTGLCCLIVILTMPLTLRLYGLPRETLRLAAILVLIHNGLAIFFWPPAFTLSNALRAANDVTFPMCVSIASMLLMRLGLGCFFAFYFGLGAIGVWIAMVLDWIVRLSFFVTRYRSGKWRTFYHGD